MILDWKRDGQAEGKEIKEWRVKTKKNNDYLNVVSKLDNMMEGEKEKKEGKKDRKEVSWLTYDEIGNMMD